MTSGTVVAVGECMIELSSAEGGLYRRGFAGDTFNTAWHLRRSLPAAWTVGYASAVGDDPLSDEMLAFMQDEGIGTELVRRLPGLAPGLYMIHLEGGERSFSYWRSASAARRLADDAAHLVRITAAADALYLSGITLAILDNAGRQTIVDRMAAAKADGRLVAFDPNIRPRLWTDAAQMRSWIERGAGAATICLPSFSDEATVFGDPDPATTVRRYLALGAAEVVVKDGAEAALVDTGEGTVAVPAEPAAAVVDTTGAGDSFNAAYLAARLQGAAPVDAAAAGHRLAARVIGRHGALVRD
ncbi:sugar kinase [Aurantimonas sp. MSK8Z-1]|uniref:sugar kinase n=1 Tax=Mangrovibrevibacter kandeliae TaxID=2968473 RepID=UPI0021193B7C|nr:sugar kinase [Aurantimonas sp. MSK8Z-1]MCW4116787.1 sugar kinase [Aurantimonas sp. MSK8Z-1]